MEGDLLALVSQLKLVHCFSDLAYVSFSNGLVQGQLALTISPTILLNQTAIATWSWSGGFVFDPALRLAIVQDNSQTITTVVAEPTAFTGTMPFTILNPGYDIDRPMRHNKA